MFKQIALLQPARLSEISATLHLNTSISLSVENPCDRVSEMAAIRRVFHIISYTAPFATLVYTRMSIELQNSAIFFVFLSLVEITYRYGIIQTNTLRNFRPCASAQTVLLISQTLTAILRQRLWTK